MGLVRGGRGGGSERGRIKGEKWRVGRRNLFLHFFFVCNTQPLRLFPPPTLQTPSRRNKPPSLPPPPPSPSFPPHPSSPLPFPSRNDGFYFSPLSPHPTPPPPLWFVKIQYFSPQPQPAFSPLLRVCYYFARCLDYLVCRTDKQTKQASENQPTNPLPANASIFIPPPPTPTTSLNDAPYTTSLSPLHPPPSPPQQVCDCTKQSNKQQARCDTSRRREVVVPKPPPKNNTQSPPVVEVATTGGLRR